MRTYRPRVYMYNDNRSETVFELVDSYIIYADTFTGEQELYVLTEEEVTKWIEDNRVDGFDITYF